MTIDQNFIEQYRELLILQYSDKEKAVAEIDLLSGTWSKVFTFFNAFFTEFDLDTASGDRLDKIGKIVGAPRVVQDGLAKKYFGFEGITNALTFGAGPFFSIINDSGFTSTELNDTQYRFFIRSKIAKNITSAFMTSDERQSLQETIQFLFKNRAFVTDNKDMTLTLYVDESFPVEDLTLLQALDLIPKPQGVGIKNIVSFAFDETFGFANNPNAKGFGLGKFARITS